MQYLLIFDMAPYRRQLVRCGLAAMLMVVGLVLPSAHAFVGDVVGIELNGVTCTNTTTGAMAAGVLMPEGAYDCQPLPTVTGDLVEVTLSGMAKAGNLDCVDVVENATAPPIVTLTEGACFNLMGSIAIGYDDLNNPTPGFEIDGFVLQTTAPTAMRLSLSGDTGVEYVKIVGDTSGNLLLNCVLTSASCRGAVVTPVSAIAVFASAPGTYMLELRVVTIDNSTQAISQATTSSDHVASTVINAVRQNIER